MGAKQCCGSQMTIITLSSLQNNQQERSDESQYTNDIDVLRRAIIQPIKPSPLGQIQSLREDQDEDLDDILYHFHELERRQKP